MEAKQMLTTQSKQKQIKILDYHPTIFMAFILFICINMNYFLSEKDLFEV
jgi:hypothetical protein